MGHDAQPVVAPARSAELRMPLALIEKANALHEGAVGARLVSTGGCDDVDIGLTDRLVKGDAAGERHSERALLSSSEPLRAAQERRQAKGCSWTGQRGEERDRRGRQRGTERGTHDSSPEGRVTMLELPRLRPRRLAMSWASCGCDVPARRADQSGRAGGRSVSKGKGERPRFLARS